MTPPNPPRQKPTPNTSPASIRADEVLTLEAAAKRLRWKRHSKAQAIRNGLVTSKFGSRRYVLGRHILEFFERLASEQAEKHDPITPNAPE